MSRTFFFSWRELTSSSDLTQKTPNYLFIIPAFSVRCCNQSVPHVRLTTGMTSPRSAPPTPTRPSQTTPTPQPQPISGCAGETAVQPQPRSSNFPSHHFFFSHSPLFFSPSFSASGSVYLFKKNCVLSFLLFSKLIFINRETFFLYLPAFSSF